MPKNVLPVAFFSVMGKRRTISLTRCEGSTFRVLKDTNEGRTFIIGGRVKKQEFLLSET